MEIYLIRHGETKWNEMGLLQGNADIELNFNGRELAGKTGRKLEGTDFDMIFSSPLIRAYETACLIRGYRNIQIERSELLKELCFGINEGGNFKELVGNKDDTFHYFFDSPQNYKPPKGGETLESIVSRAGQFMRTKIEPFEQKYKRVMIVAHGAMNQALLTYICKSEIKDFWKHGLQKNCGGSIVKLVNGQYDIIGEL